MLGGLRLDAIIRSDHQHDAIDATSAGKHIAHEGMVAGNVDQAELGLLMLKTHRRKTQVDGDAAALLFRKPVSVGARQAKDKRCLSMIYMAGRAKDNRSHLCSPLLSSMPACIV